LNLRGFSAEYAATGREAKKIILGLVGDSNCGFGGSVTVRDLGIYDALKSNGNQLYWHWMAPAGEKDEMHRKAMQADFFIASANAVTESGALVNTDRTGNRIAAMFFGPKNVIIVAGVNKLVPDLDAAMKRIKDVAAPLNAKRVGLKTPCAKTGNCFDCSSHERICNITAVMDAPSSHTEKEYVILVGEELGY
jgi:L-lactate utilization protein LutB